MKNKLSPSELRIGNIIWKNFTNDREEFEITKGFHIDGADDQVMKYEPIPLTDEWLVKFGFNKKENKSYINKFEYTLQVTRDYGEKEINEDGTWFDGIGTFNYNKTGFLVVNTLTKGNYTCGAVEYVHQLQNLYFALTGKELIIK